MKENKKTFKKEEKFKAKEKRKMIRERNVFLNKKERSW